MPYMDPFAHFWRRLTAPFRWRPEPPLKPSASGERHLDTVAPDPDPAGDAGGGSKSTEKLVARAANPKAPSRDNVRPHR